MKEGLLLGYGDCRFDSGHGTGPGYRLYPQKKHMQEAAVNIFFSLPSPTLFKINFKIHIFKNEIMMNLAKFSLEIIKTTPWFSSLCTPMWWNVWASDPGLTIGPGPLGRGSCTHCLAWCKHLIVEMHTIPRSHDLSACFCATFSFSITAVLDT